jgi:ribose/xylose/arabinose/galactoside ABC-type transport system permease subunit
VPVVIFIIIAVVAYLVAQYTTFGRSIYAVGGNPVSAFLSGINVRRVLFLVFIISGFLGAVAGVISMSRAMVGSMTTVIGLELDSIAASVIGGVSLMGGRGTLIGTVIGSLIIGVVNNGMSVIALSPAYQDLTKGAIIILAVAVDYIRRR